MLIRDSTSTVDDEYGNPEPGTPTLTAVLCHAFPGTAGEDTANAQVSMTTWTVWLPPDATAVASARVALADGPTLELTGDAMPFRSPRTGVVEYLQAPALVVT